jgi:hypothetical protein
MTYISQCIRYAAETAPTLQSEYRPTVVAVHAERQYRWTGPIMSYDLEVRSDESYSASVATALATQVILAQSGIKQSGPMAFVLDDLPGRWMEIDLEVVDGHGDYVDQGGNVPSTVNCIRFHVPYGFLKLGTEIKDIYLPVVSSIGAGLSWNVFHDATQLTTLSGLSPG